MPPSIAAKRIKIFILDFAGPIILKLENRIPSQS
jgi:hypothetical protein